MPQFQKELDGRYKGENIQFFGISMGDDQEYLKRFKQHCGVSFPWLALDIRRPNPYYQEVFDQWELGMQFATVVIIDDEGIIRFRDYGGDYIEKSLDYRKAFDFIGELLRERAKQ